MTSLDYLPSSLNILDCDYNPITNLDCLPSSLKELNCSINEITSLDSKFIGCNLTNSLIKL